MAMMKDPNQISWGANAIHWSWAAAPVHTTAYVCLMNFNDAEFIQ